MKLIILLCLVAVAVARPDGGFYDSRYDDFNVDDVLSSTRLLNSFAKCFLGEGKCSVDGNNFKKWIPDAVQTNCGRCTEKQKVLVAKVIRTIRVKLPTEWEKLYSRHDPQKQRVAELDAYIDKYGH